MSKLSAIVLAAGLGKRTKSALPKVLHPCAGRPLLHYSVRAAIEAGADEVVIVASPETSQAVERELVAVYGRERILVTVQHPPRGTGDAARVGVQPIKAPHVLILCGDTPLLTAADLRLLTDALALTPSARLAVLSAMLDDPTGYGRVLRDAHGSVSGIREHRDCSDSERAVREVNAGVYVFETEFLRASLLHLTPANNQGEYYLTDVIAMGAGRGGAIGVVGSRDNLLGVNDRAQLVEAESLLFARVAREHALRGVTVRAGACIEDTVTLGGEVVVGAGVHLRGGARVEDRATIDVGAVITNATIGRDAVIGAYAVIDGVDVSPGARIAPHTVLSGQTQSSG